MNACEIANFSVEFGSFIREAREKKGLYQEDVAKLVGISRSHYAFIEAGQRRVFLDLAINICNTLDLDISEFIDSLQR